MNTITLPSPVYSFLDYEEEVSDSLSRYYYKVYSNYYYLFDNLYRSEFFGLSDDPYEPINDIFLLLDLLVRIQWEISVTPIADRLTYLEYLEKYKATCIIEYLRCKHKIDAMQLLYAYDEAYGNPILSPTDDTGIGHWHISGEEVHDLDFVIQ